MIVADYKAIEGEIEGGDNGTLALLGSGLVCALTNCPSLLFTFSLVCIKFAKKENISCTKATLKN